MYKATILHRSGDYQGVMTLLRDRAAVIRHVSEVCATRDAS
jgi:hypothetical protein